MADFCEGNGFPRGVRVRAHDVDRGIQSNAGLATGERMTVHLNISRLFAQRDELLERASADTRRRTQLQKELVVLDDEISHTADVLLKAQEDMRRREDEIIILCRRIELLEKTNLADKQALQILSDRIARIKECATFKVGQLVRYVAPYVPRATQTMLQVVYTSIGKVVPILVAMLMGW